MHRACTHSVFPVGRGPSELLSPVDVQRGLLLGKVVHRGSSSQPHGSSDC